LSRSDRRPVSANSVLLCARTGLARPRASPSTAISAAAKVHGVKRHPELVPGRHEKIAATLSGCTRVVPSFDKSYRSLGSRKLERSISSLFLKCVREVSKRETVSDRFGGFLNRAPPAQIKSTPHLTNGIFLPGTLGGTLRFHLCPLDANSLAIRPRCMASASAGVTIGIVEVALFAATAGPLAGARITSG
jgi:hypothetical protein